MTAHAPENGVEQRRTSVIDCCVHHQWASEHELREYLPSGWQEFLGEPGSLPGGLGSRPIEIDSAYADPLRRARVAHDANGGDGAHASHPTSRGDHDDLAAVILTFDTGLYAATHPNPFFAAEIVNAANRWSLEHWLDDGGNRYGMILAATQTPDEAAEEIRRLATHSRVAGVALGASGIGKPFGHPLYLPIYKAAVEAGLPVMIHAQGDRTLDSINNPTAGGSPMTYGECNALAAQPLMTHITSLIAHGVFEKLRDLRVVVSGGGVAWLPSFLWRLDMDFKGLNRELPWLKRLPSEYFMDHVKVVTYPLDEPPDPPALFRLLETVEGVEDLLCYGSGTPHSNADEIDDVEPRLPEKWRNRVFSDNARRVLRLVDLQG